MTLIVYNNIDSVQLCLWRYLNKNKCFIQHYWAHITSCSGIIKWFAFSTLASQASLRESHVFRAVNAPRLQILRIDRAGMMNDVIIQLKAHNVICAKNTLWLRSSQNMRKRCPWHCNIWLDCFTSQQWHYYIKMSYQSFLGNVQIRQNGWNFIAWNSSLLKKWQTLVIIREISSSNLESKRYGPISGVSWLIQESWQHCVFVQ